MSTAQLLPLSARSPEALAGIARSHLRALGEREQRMELADLCYTAGARRDHHRYRRALVARSRDEAVAQLAVLVADGDGLEPVQAAPSLRFVLPGVARLEREPLLELLGSELAFLEAMERCDAALESLGVDSLLAEVAGDAPLRAAGDARAAAIAFAVELALAELWRSWGIEPDTASGAGPGAHAATALTGERPLDEALAAAIAGEDSAPQELDAAAAILEMTFLPLPPSASRGRSADNGGPPRDGGAGDGRARDRLLAVAADLYALGFEPRWDVLAGAGARCIRLPTYPWQREPLAPEGLEAARRPAGSEAAAPTAGGEAASPAAPAAPRDAFVALAARVLQLPSERLLPHETLPAQGLDSLMAMELRTLALQEVGAELSLERIAGGATLDELAGEAERTAGEPSAAPLATIEADAEARHEPFALSEIQQAYYVGRQGELELGGVSTHVYIEVEGTGIDAGRLREAIDRLVARHDMLRAVVEPGGRQRVLPEVPSYDLRVEDLAGLPDDEREQRLEGTREELSHQVLDAATWPLFEIRLSRLGDRDRLHLSFDLLVADAASLFQLGRELAAIYDDPAAELPELEVQFRDYAVAERALDDSAEVRRAWDYWRARLDDLPPAPELPLARTPGEIGTPRFSRLAATLDADAWDALKERAREHGITASTICAAAYAEVIARHARHPRFTLNLTNYRRLALHEQVHQLVGDFTSLTLLEVDAGGEESFAERARAMQAQLWRDLEHRAVNGVSVLRELGRRRGQREAAMPVVFTSVLNHTGREDHPLDAFGDEVYAISQTPQVHVDHQVMERDGALALNWDYVDGLYPDGFLDSMFEAYADLLRVLAEDPDAWDERRPLALPADQAARRAHANDTAAPAPTGLLHEPFLARAEETPDAPALRCGDEELTYGELVRLARSAGAELRRRGAEPNRLVAVVAEKGVWQLAATACVLESGAAYLPLDPELPADRLHWLIEQTEATLALTTAAADARVDWPAGVDRIRLDEWEPEPDPPPLEPAAAPDDLAYVIFTSGSTGRPKGVMIEHRAALNTVVDINRRFGTSADDRVLALSALSFDLSVWDIYGTLAAGATVVVPEPGKLRDPAHWAGLVDAGVTVWNSVPALLKLFVEHLERRERALPDHVRLAMLSGDWIPLSLPDRVRALNPDTEVISLGGATEASIWSIYHRVGEVDPAWESIPYGRPLANQRFHVLDDAHDERPDWVPGELYIAGDGLARGYWRDEEKTAAAFITHPRTGEPLYRTGDIGRWRPEGWIEFLGREDAQVKVHGYRIELGEVEAALEAHPEVATAVAVALGERDQRRLVAHYVPAAGAQPEPADLRAFMGERLPAYMLPSALNPIERVPLSANGKVDRKALPDPSRRRASARAAELDADGARARLCLESHVAPLLGLGEGELDPAVPLSAYGLDSLAAIELRDAVAAELGGDVPLQSLLDGASLNELAQELGAQLAAGAQAVDATRVVADEAARHEPFPLSEIQQAYFVGRHGGLELGGVSTHVYLEVEGTGVDADRLSAAIDRLVARHDMMRAVVDSSGEQRVLSEVPPYDLRVEDLAGLPDDEREQRLEATREELAHQVLDAATWPLFEIRLSRLGDRDRLHLSFDMLVADAASLFLLGREVAVLYANPDAELPELTLRFRDYVAAERTLEESDEARRDWDYWRERIADLPPAPDLPLARTPAELGTPRFLRLAGRLDARRWEALKDRARQENLTVSTLVAAAYAEVIARHARNESFTLNLTNYRRLPLHEQVHQVVGDFTSLTLLAVDASGDEPFADRARAVQAQLWQDLEHRAVGGVRVLRELARTRGPQAALMPVVFTSVLNHTGSEPYPLDVFGEEVYAISQTPQVHLDHQVMERDGELLFNWDLVEGLYPDGMAEAMFEAFSRLLERLADDPAAWEESSPVEASSEQARWREEYRAATPARPRRRRRAGPLDERIAAAVRDELGLDRLDPDLHVLEQGATSLELVRLADGLEDRLGVRPELELLFAPQSAGELVDGLASLTKEVPA